MEHNCGTSRRKCHFQKGRVQKGRVHKTAVNPFGSSQGEQTEDAVTRINNILSLIHAPSMYVIQSLWKIEALYLRPDHEVIIMNIASCF